MTRKRTRWPLAAPLALVALGAGCGGSSPTSSADGGGGGSAASHNAGRDCLACHRGEFGVAGTVYRVDGSAYPGATVRVTTALDGGGSVVLTVTADASGNFYASRSVAFGSGLYTDVTGTGGARRAMKAAVTGGACNSCHDASNRIRAD